MAAKKKKPSAPSTERLPPFARQHDEIDGLSAALMGRFGLDSAAQLDAVLRDEARIDQALESVSAFGLALLDLLVTAGGMLTEHLARRLLGNAWPKDPTIWRQTCHDLHHRGLAYDVTLGARTYLESQAHACLLPVEVAPVVARKVAGASLPDELDPEHGGRDREWRDRIAIIAAAAHHPMKLTAQANINRSSSKKLAAQLARPNAEVCALLDRAYRSGILLDDGGSTQLDARALLRLARAETTLTSGPDWIGRVLASTHGWVSSQSLLRALAREYADRLCARGRLLADVNPHLGGMREELSNYIDAERVVVDKCLHLRARRVAQGPLTGDGHITPSFDIMLGPDASLELVACLGIAAELVRLDQVISLRLTPRSINNAIGIGIPLKEIEEALGAVSRHPVPDNVTYSVRDWSTNVKSARVRRVWAIETNSQEAADLAARTLGSHVVARPDATTVLVEVRDSQDPHAALRKAGLQLPAAPREKRKVAASSHAQRAIELIRSTASPQIRARVAHDAKAGWTASIREAEAGTQGGAEDEPTPMEVLMGVARGAKPMTAALLAGVARLWAPVWPEFRAWSARLPQRERDEALDLAISQPILLTELLALAPKWRKRILASAADVGDVIDAAERQPQARFSSEGRQVLAAIDAVPDDVGDEFDEIASSSWGLVEPGDIARTVLDVSDDDVFDRPPVRTAAPEPSPAAAKMDPSLILKSFREAADSGATVTLRVNSKTSGERTFELHPERALERGTDITLLGVDCETEENRSFPLANIVSLTTRSAPN